MPIRFAILTVTGCPIDKIAVSRRLVTIICCSGERNGAAPGKASSRPLTYPSSGESLRGGKTRAPSAAFRILLMTGASPISMRSASAILLHRTLDTFPPEPAQPSS